VTRKKLDDRAKKAILIGYTPTSQQYLLYNLASNREFLARNVQFNEGCLYSELLGLGSLATSSTATIAMRESTSPPGEYLSTKASCPPSMPPAPPVTVTTSTTPESEDEASQQLQLEATVQPPQAASPLQAASPRQAASVQPATSVPLSTTPVRSTPGEWVDTESALSDCPDPYLSLSRRLSLLLRFHKICASI
jgi:hypothetical protein